MEEVPSQEVVTEEVEVPQEEIVVEEIPSQELVTEEVEVPQEEIVVEEVPSQEVVTEEVEVPQEETVAEEAPSQESVTEEIEVPQEEIVVEEVPSQEVVTKEVEVPQEETVAEEVPSQELVTEESTELVSNKDSLESITNEPHHKLSTYDINRLYVGFQTRVGLLVTGILILFGLACFMIISTLQKYEVRKIDYSETSGIHYEVCSNNSKCVKENEMYFADNTSTMHVDYHYEAKFAEKIEYDLSYYVVINHKIFDRFDSNKISYEQEDTIIEKKNIHSTDNVAKIDVNVDVDYQKYRSFVADYKQKYSDASSSTISVIMYVDDGSTTRNVGEAVIPLVKDQFHIKVNDVKNSPQVYNLESSSWTQSSIISIIIGCILVLLSLFLLFHLTKLVMTLAGKKSKYQDYLMFILNEYDRLIVNATEDFEISMNKKLIKVYTFEELLDIRSVLNKPIIYSKINNVKSEFVVEDEEVVYKYVLKEADMGE